jgi:hypothetical protein
MQTDDKIRTYYNRYTRKEKNSRVKSRPISSNWGYSFFLLGASVGILFFAFILQDEFNNMVLSSMGIFSLLFVIIGFIILINNR